MKNKSLISMAVLLVALSRVAIVAAVPVSFDDGWRFEKADLADAGSATFDDSAWAAVELPHDWSIAGPIVRDNPSGHAGGFLPSGIGWYRKTFDVPMAWKGKRVAIEFDGSYMQTEVFINGQRLGKHVSGFSAFDFDVTPHLRLGERNTIAVRVDNSRQPNARWYAGSGIYRHVNLAVRDPIHIQRLGTFVTTPIVSAEAATVDLSIDVVNHSDIADASIESTTQIFLAGRDGEPAGDVLATFAPAAGKFAGTAREKTIRLSSQATLPSPKLWSPESPTLYVAMTTIRSDGREVDTRSTTFGVRTIEVSAEKGFLLNGKSIELYGACVHEDNGPLGVAALERAIVRRVELLKAAGFNAVRCAHNPPAPAFLDACDRLGLLVINEAFDTWSAPKNPGDFGHHFNELWKDELDRMILRDRNHPSIVIWSVGNEVWLWDRQAEKSAVEGARLIRRTKQMDPTRLVTTAVAGWNLPDRPWEQMTPLLNQFDVVGYNYAIHRYDSDHRQFPKRVIVGTESFPRELFETFDTSDRLGHVIGDFVWTGIDYLGESGIGQYVEPGKPVLFHTDPNQFPYHAAYCGDIDITGFRKPISYARNITWGRGETLHTSVAEMTPDGQKMQLTAWAVEPSRESWTWPGYEGKTMEVLVYSRHEAVRLYLDDKLIGEQPTTREQKFRAVFQVPYTPGTLRTVGLKDGKEVETQILRTAGPVAGLRVTVDRTEIAADGQDLAYVTVESVDADGHFQPTGSQTVVFRIDGSAARLAGVASANYATTQGYQETKRDLFQGRAQAVIRSTRSAGSVMVHATAEGLPAGSVTVQVR